jgi:Tfp pilus tip-associated adhesin PilY1
MAAPKSSVKVDGDGAVSWTNRLAYIGINQSAPGERPLCLESAAVQGARLDPANPDNICPPGPAGRGDGRLDKGGVWRLDLSGPPSSWKSSMGVLIDTSKPVSAAINTTFDAAGRLWVLFGTGRYWSDEDSAPCEGAPDLQSCRLNHVNRIYGIKEPVNPSTGELTMAEVTHASLTDVSDALVFPSGKLARRDKRGDLEPFELEGSEITHYQDLAALIASDGSGGYFRALATGSRMNVGGRGETPDPDDPDWWTRLRFESILEPAALAPHGRAGSIMSMTSFMPEAGTCGSYGRSHALLLDTFTGLPKPEFGKPSFLEANPLTVNAEDVVDGESPISDHVTSVAGKSSAPVLIVTGGNESKVARFEIVNSDGTVTVFKLPESRALTGGVISWREVLDLSMVGE